MGAEDPSKTLERCPAAEPGRAMRGSNQQLAGDMRRPNTPHVARAPVEGYLRIMRTGPATGPIVGILHERNALHVEIADLATAWPEGKRASVRHEVGNRLFMAAATTTG